ncbi:GrpB family protein [Staphylococcus sp. 18_1_E_LY]|uniref:GrpB family protein n=1 Tax=Staphylococcus lloydii TaxID=2781774 RepID=A0A7T1F9J7_9STAP|nr:GrpB family protein [Staphylococcus lloydii]MBF7019995.1 GrpB family protein [Staphylococcus lloydii]MBF7027678.1 GrpB family protein [Staphylococcus lloydii]QPM75360.1 GrpB family protein [Staphylococcus lloydii]
MQVEVTAHNPRWKDDFEKEAQKIMAIYDDLLLEIYHIGSTSVAGLKAKPVIDMMPIVSDINKVDKFDDQMLALGYEPLGENGIVGRRFFRKCNMSSGKRTYHVHIFDPSSQDEIIRHLAFKAYLIAHPEIANQYGNLKSRLGAAFPDDIESYMDGKNAFIKETEKQAVVWYEGNSNS